jgi:Chaperone of endosialidase
MISTMFGRRAVRHTIAGVLIVVSFSFVGLLHTAQAAINEQIAFYGTLQDSLGNNLDGSYDIVFRFYNAPTGGTLLDTSTHTAANGNEVVVTGGEFSVKLGSGTGNALDGLNFNSDLIYIGVTIESDSEMIPRERLTAAPYAFNTDTLDGFDSLELLRLSATNTIEYTSSDSLLRIVQNGIGDVLNIFSGATEVFSILSSGNVGVGTSSPSHLFSVEGDVYFTNALFDNANFSGLNGYVLQSTGSGFAWVATSSLGISGGGGGGSTFLSLSDTPGVFTPGRLFFTNASGTAVTDSSNLGFDGSDLNLGVGVGITIGPDPYFYGDSFDENIFVGNQAGASTTALIRFSTLYGAFAGYQSDGYYNSFTGYYSGHSSIGDDNSYYGYYAGFESSGDNNNFFGSGVGENNVGDNNIAIGEYTGQFNVGSDNIFFGDNAGASNQGFSNFFAGYYAGWLNDGNNNIGIGSNAAFGSVGDFNIALGFDAGEYTFGDRNTSLGGLAGQRVVGNDNISIGYEAGDRSEGNNNFLAGYNAGGVNQGDFNIFIGADTGVANFGDGSLYLGHNAGRLNSGGNNQLLGYQTGEFLVSTSTVAVGSESFYGSHATTFIALNNVALGYRAGYAANDGADNNILLGYQAADNLTTGNNNIIIGYNIDSPTATADNRLVIGNLLYGTGIDGTGTTVSSGNIGIGTSTPTAQLHTTGSVRLSTFGAGTLQTDASGNVSVSSDERLKNIVSDFRGGIDAVNGLQPILFRWSDESGFETETQYLGFSAQNVRDYVPEAVGEDSRGFLTLSDRGILAAVVNSIKDIWETLTEQTKQVDDLSRKVQTLEQKIESLEQTLDSQSRQNQFESSPLVEPTPEDLTPPPSVDGLENDAVLEDEPVETPIDEGESTVEDEPLP